MDEKTCLSCSTAFTGSYCNNCGEKIYRQKDKSFVHIFEEVFHFLTHFEGTLLRSVKTMFTSPGLYSLDFCRGVRKKYFKPVSLYILLVVLYLIFPFFRGLNMPLEGYTAGVFTRTTVKDVQQKKGISYEEFKTKFDARSEKVSKFMLLAVLPLCGMLLMLLFYWKKYFYFDHFILAAEINSLFLMVLFIILPLALNLLTLLSGGIQGGFMVPDDIITVIGVLVVTTYATISFRRFYNTSLPASALLSMVYAAGQLFIIFFVYRLLLFKTVMALI